jgi:hypothetical protein
MSSELKTMLNEIAVEENELRKKEFEEGINRYKSLLLRIAKEEKLDITILFQGTERLDLNRNEQDLKVLERANLVEGKTKYTHRNTYRRYVLTTKGAGLVEKLSKES